jgi:hypothetical protein
VVPETVIEKVAEAPSLMEGVFRVMVATGAGEVSATVTTALVPITGPVVLPVLMSITHVSGPSVVRSFAQVRVTVSTRPGETV